MLVQPMRYCYTFTSGSLEDNLVADERKRDAAPYSSTIASHPNYTTSHWTADGFKGRVLQVVELHRPLDGEMVMEEYVEVKVFGQGRKHFVKRNNEKTKVVWIQKRLVSKCRGKKNN